MSETSQAQVMQYTVIDTANLKGFQPRRRADDAAVVHDESDGHNHPP